MRRGRNGEDGWSKETLRDFDPAKRYLVGVSGGRDSVVLLDWLLRGGYGRLIVCHLDHRLRGRSSTADARFVQRLAERNGLDFELGTANVRKLAQEKKLSIETAARAARFEFFGAVARRRRCRTIFLGHHANDLVETFLINLFRGAGTTGQRGMRAVTTRAIARVQLTIVRPLLSVWRSQIDAYIAAHRLRFREDATNQNLDALRNRMRHRIIPLLAKEFGRDITKSVRRAAIIAADENALFDQLLPAETTARLSVKELRGLAVALQRRTIARWLRQHAVNDISFDIVESVRDLLDAETGPAKANLPADRHVRRRGGELFIE